MIRLGVVALVVALQCVGAALAGAPADPSSSAPKTPPEAAPKAPAKEAAKQAAKAGGERIGDWTLFCPEAEDKTKPPSCTLEQLLIDAETKRVAFHLAVGYGPRGNLVLVVRAPLGIALVRGLEVTFGTQPMQRAPFNICLSNGCQAVLILSKPLQEEVVKAERALITVYAPKGDPFQAVASLKGLGAALDTLNKRRGPS
ncbi:MAG: invasion associated locus B family protein [Methyloceanibacter sp.]